MKKLKIILIFIVILLIGVLVFTNSKKDVKIDIDNLSEMIMQSIKFEDEMNEADKATVEKIYNINNSITQKVYLSSGATAEEIAIFEFENKDDVNIAYDKSIKRIEEQKESFKNYVPKEMNKLNNATIIKKGKYLIVCVTDDENIENIINQYTK